MKITKHITFFYLEERIQYINKIIDETNQYTNETDIFIHTNNFDLLKKCFHSYQNGSLQIIYHNLIGEDPFFLSWKCRDLLYSQRNDYDIFMYIEDDILVPCKAINYWLTNHEKLIENKYNLGFVRIEINNQGEEYITDVYSKLTQSINLYGQNYAINNINPYCAFWIYNKNEFHYFIESPHWLWIGHTNSEYGIRERSAIGLHNINKTWYKDTLIPIINQQLNEDCKIYHLPNNYLSHEKFAKIKFHEIL